MFEIAFTGPFGLVAGVDGFHDNSGLGDLVADISFGCDSIAATAALITAERGRDSSCAVEFGIPAVAFRCFEHGIGVAETRLLTAPEGTPARTSSTVPVARSRCEAKTANFDILSGLGLVRGGNFFVHVILDSIISGNFVIVVSGGGSIVIVSG